MTEQPGFLPLTSKGHVHTSLHSIGNNLSYKKQGNQLSKAAKTNKGNTYHLYKYPVHSDESSSTFSMYQTFFSSIIRTKHSLHTFFSLLILVTSFVYMQKSRLGKCDVHRRQTETQTGFFYCIFKIWDT